MNVNNGNESGAHRYGKRELTEIFTKIDFDLVFCEKGCGDVIAVKRVNGGFHTIACEVEFSVRNLLVNIHRDLGKSGCDGVIVVTLDFITLGEVARKLARELPMELQEKVGVTTLQTLRMITPQ